MSHIVVSRKNNPASFFQAEVAVHPANLKEGQPQLTMTSLSCLDDLAPFFASICNNVTRQQTKSKTEIPHSAIDVINAIIEKDFLEALP